MRLFRRSARSWCGAVQAHDKRGGYRRLWGRVRAVRAAAAGGVSLGPAIADRALTDVARHGNANAGGEDGHLSPRETEVLRLTAQGLNNKEIAARLDVSVKTVETYKSRAAEKLGLRTRADLVRYGVTHGRLEGL